MKPSLSIFVVGALLALMAGSTPQKSNSEPSTMGVHFAQSWSELPLPAVHLRFSGAAAVIEFGYRYAGIQTAPARRLLTLRLTLNQSGDAQLVIRTHNHRFAFPRRGA